MLRFFSCDLRTGARIAFLPSFVPEWPLRRTLCRYEQASGKLHLDGAPKSWQAAIRPGSSVIACYDTDDPARTIQWGGIVLEETRDSDEDDAVPLSLVTGEGYLDRRFVGDKLYESVGQNAIVSDLILNYVADGAKPGIPLTVRWVPTGDQGVLRSVQFNNTENASVYSRLSQLAQNVQGIEWTLQWEWADNKQGIVPVLIVGERIGQDPPDGQSPSARFSMPGNLLRIQQISSYSSDKGANDITAISSGSGTASPNSRATALDFMGRPTFETRFQPATAVTSQIELDSYARRAVALAGPGQEAIALTAILNDETRHGGSWSLGDSVFYRAGGIDPITGKDRLRVFPGGITGIRRSYGFELSQPNDGAPTITPILATPTIADDGISGGS